MSSAICSLELGSRWHKIQSFEFDDPGAKQPFSKTLSEEMDWDEDFTNQVIDEYRKFMLLSSMQPEKTVPSIHIDTVWHLHLLYTRSYQLFCREALECEFHHHHPGSGNDGEEDTFRSLYFQTMGRYEDLFGCCPPSSVWGGAQI